LRDTGLAEQLRAQGVTRLAVCGLATDYCVLNTVNDALAAGFQVMLVRDAVRAVEVSPGDGARAIAAMAGGGAQVVQTRRPTLLDEAALVDPAGAERPQRILDTP
jgi:nicotinamidase/pyrazinamidase